MFAECKSEGTQGFLSSFVWLTHRVQSVHPPRPLYKLRKVPNSYGPYAHCSLDEAVDAWVQNEEMVQERGI